MKASIRLSALFILLIANAPHVLAEVRLAGIFADHMVLQQDRSIQVWGWADKGELVTRERLARDSSDIHRGTRPIANMLKGRLLRRARTHGQMISFDSLLLLLEDSRESKGSDTRAQPATMVQSPVESRKKGNIP